MKGKLYSIYLLIAALLLAVNSTSFANDHDAKKSENAAKASAKEKINVNTADSATLQTLPGVGPSIATEIIAARPFKNVNELEKIPGIGKERMKDIRPLVRVRETKANVGTAAPGTGGADKARQRPQRAGDPDAAPRSANVGGKVNINTASQAELESLLGIGPVKAQAIIEGRPYRSIDEVMNVKGIKEGTFEEIRDHITVR